MTPPIHQALRAGSTPAHVVARQRGLVSRLHQLKLSEPVRLYAYAVLAYVLVILVIVGTITEEWQMVLTGMAAAVLGVAPAATFIRASVYSPRTVARLRLMDQAAADAERRRAAGHVDLDSFL